MTMSAIFENPSLFFLESLFFSKLRPSTKHRKSADVLYDFMDGWYIVKTARRRQFCDFYRPLKTISCRLQNEKNIYICTSQGRQCSGWNKRIRKENWLQKHLILKLRKSIFRMQFAPSCKCKMVMPVQNYNFICSCIQILTWHCNECWQLQSSHTDNQLRGGGLNLANADILFREGVLKC